jgi:hypothetical protein
MRCARSRLFGVEFRNRGLTMHNSGLGCATMTMCDEALSGRVCDAASVVVTSHPVDELLTVNLAMPAVLSGREELVAASRNEIR